MDSFTKLDPNTLPEELRPWYQSMQADYTRKTQQLAEQRKALEGIADPEEARIAVDLLHTLGTPEGALSFHQLLSEQLQSLGLTPAEADAAATQQMQQPYQEPTVPSFDDDPEAALKAHYDSLSQEVQTMRAQLEAERQQAQAEQAYYTLAAEIQRQEAMVRESNPHYSDADLNAIYEIAPSFGGNLVQAANRYEEIVSNRVSQILNSKAATVQETGIQPLGTPGHAQEPRHFETLDQADAAAREYLRQLELQDV